MSINEQILTGRKFRRLSDEATKLWQRISFWTKAVDVEFNDGKTAEAKVGAIDGITDSLNNTSSRIAASAKALNQLNNSLVSDLKVNGEGKLVVTKGGADTVLNFSSVGLKLMHIRYVVGASGYSPYGSINVQLKNESATYLNSLNVNKNETIYGYSGTDEPEFMGGNTQYGISVPSMWTEVTGTDISMYKYIWIRYTFNTTVAKKTATFDIQ